MKNVIIVSEAPIGAKMAGTAIRAWNFAKELSDLFKVTLFIPNDLMDFKSSDNIRIIKISRKILKNELKDAQVIIVQGLTLFKYPYIKTAGVPIVVDIYDPFIFENLELRKKHSFKDRMKYHFADLKILLDQIAYGDYFICASEKQKDFWLGMLAANNKINPLTYDMDNTLDKLIGVVPFGIDNNDSKIYSPCLKGIYPGIEVDDKVMIWAGGIWEWFNPVKLIYAQKIIYDRRKNVKLFFMGTGDPTKNQNNRVVNESIKLSKELGLYNKAIFFNEWVDFSKRQNYLLDSDFGVTTYDNNIETTFSFRTRFLDYIWCDLPMVISKGDYLSKYITENNMGISIDSPEEIAHAIIDLVDNKDMYNIMKENIKKQKEQFRWENVTQPLKIFCENPTKIPHRKIKYISKVNCFTYLLYYLIRLKVRIIQFIRGITTV